MLTDIRFWLLFIILLVIALGIQQIIFILANKKGNKEEKNEDGIN